MKKILSRADRKDILARCLKNSLLNHRCYKSYRLLGTSVPDLMQDIGVQVYRALYYFRFTERYAASANDPLTGAFKMALTTAHNYLTSLIRTALKKHTATVAVADLTNVRSNALTDGQIYEVLELMASVARSLVGQELAGYLLRASVYNWERRRPALRLNAAQRELLTKLNLKDRHAMEMLLNRFREQMRIQLAQSTHDSALLTKTAGIWRAVDQALG